MLVLSRSVGEQVVIGDSVVITVVGVRSGQVRLGFTAPEDVRVLRAELSWSEPSSGLAPAPPAPVRG